ARMRFADAAQFRRAVMAALARHAPGYDAEVLARDLSRLHGERGDFAADVGEATDVATELRRARPRLAIVDRTPTPPGVATLTADGASPLMAEVMATLPPG